MNRKALILLLTTLVFSSPGMGQDLELGLNLFPSLAHNQAFEPGTNGISLDLLYLYELNEELSLKGGLEAGFCGWGSQVLFPLGIRYGSENIFGAEILNGMALYHQGPNWVFGVGLNYNRIFFRQKKHQLLLSAGFRYSVQAAYQEYGPIYAYFDLPIRISWHINR